jgi:hypothetical protein
MEFAGMIDLGRILTALGATMLLSSAAALVLLGWLLWRVRRIHLPADADFVTALQATPLTVVVFLDLLDFGMDFLSVPIAWVVLGRLGLSPLRGVTIVEEIIPGTQILPTLTLAWLAVRLLGGSRARQRGWFPARTTRRGLESHGGPEALTVTQGGSPRILEAG